MSSINVKIAIEFNNFDAIRAQMKQKASQIVRKTAFDIQAGYQQNARRDTGAQVNSAYVVTAEESTYAAATAAAEAASPGVALLPEVQPPDTHSAIIAVGAVYAAINEYGGHGRPGDGAMTQAAESARQPFYAAMQHILEP